MSRNNYEVGVISVKVARVGTAFAEYALNDARTVQDLLNAANINPKASESIRVNGDSEELDYELEDGDVVTLVKDIEGGKN